MPFTPLTTVQKSAAPTGATPPKTGGFTPITPGTKNAPAALSASSAILNAIHGVTGAYVGATTEVGQKTAGAYEEGAADITGDLDANAKVQASSAPIGTKAKSEIMAGANVAGDFAKSVFAPFTGVIGTFIDKASDNPELQKMAQSGPISALLDKTGATSKKINDWAAANPNKAKAVSDFFNIAGLVAGGGVGGDVADAARGTIDAGKEAAAGASDAIAGADKSIATGVQSMAAKTKAVAQAAREAAAGPKVDPIEDALSPRLTAKVAEKEGGTAPKGVMGNIQRVISDSTKRIASTVKEMVPDFADKKTFTEKANAVQTANNSEAEALTQKVADNNHPYTYKELNATIRGLEKPELIKSGDATVQRLFDSARSKMLSLARESGGDMSGLLKARKDFYSWVNKEYKNLWGSDQITAAREGISTIAQGVNDFIAEGIDAASPGEGDAFRSSLKNQSTLFDAEDVLREKAARGAPGSQGEIGTNRFSRYGQNHPVQKGAAKAAGIGALGALGAGGVYETAKTVGL